MLYKTLFDGNILLYLQRARSNIYSREKIKELRGLPCRDYEVIFLLNNVNNSELIMYIALYQSHESIEIFSSKFIT